MQILFATDRQYRRVAAARARGRLRNILDRSSNGIEVAHRDGISSETLEDSVFFFRR